MDIITANSGLRLARNDVNSEALEHFLFEAIQTLQENSAPFPVSILNTSARAVKDRRTLWGKTPTDLENNIEYDKQVPHNYIKKPEADIVDRDEMMPLGNDMPQTADKSLLD